MVDSALRAEGVAWTAAAGRRSLGVVWEYVVPSLASMSAAAHLIIYLVRSLGGGRIIERSGDQIQVRQDADTPRGLVILVRDGKTVDIVDLSKSGALDQALARLTRSDKPDTPDT